MKNLTIENLKTDKSWVICPSNGMIIYKSFFNNFVLTYEKQEDEFYKLDKQLDLTDELFEMIVPMLHLHNFTPQYQKEAEMFLFNYPMNTK